MNSLTVKHVEGEISNLTGDMFDVFAVLQGNDELARVRIEYAGGKTRVECEDTLAPLPGIFNNAELIGRVLRTVIGAVTENSESYAEAFYDDEGERLALPLL